MSHQSKETKQKALERWARGDDPQEICKELGIVLLTLKNWKAKAKEQNFIDTPKIGKKPSEINVESIVHAMQKHPNEQQSPEYTTSSVQVAACLELAGHHMSSLTGEGKRKEFHYTNHPDLETIARDYWNGELSGSYWQFSNKVFEILAKSKR